jgi:hypothetical protein
MKLATTTLASVLALSAPAFAQVVGGPIDSRVDSNASTGSGFPTGTYTAPRSSSSLWPYSNRVVIITKNPPKSGTPTDQPERPKPRREGRRH